MRWFFCLIPILAFSDVAEEIRRVHAHLIIDDAASALKESERLIEKYPESLEAGAAYIEALSANGFGEKAVDAWNELSEKFPDLMQDRHLLEEVCWGILRKGCQSTQYGIRLTSLVGAYLTQDARALPLLVQMMRDSNAVVRSVAIQMAAGFQDAKLKDEIRRLMQEEKIWVVRLAVIQAAGALRMKELSSQLKGIVQSDRSTYEERQLAIGSLLNIYEKISIEELNDLAKSNRAGMRLLACSIAVHFEIKEAKEQILSLIGDPNPHVRIGALNALGLFYRHQMKKEESLAVLKSGSEDADPTVAITAAWATLLVDQPLGEARMERFLHDSLGENRRLAAGALAVSGVYGIDLAARSLESCNDPYVKVNLAIGLLNQRKEIDRCSNLIFNFLQNEKRIWMWDNESNPLFQALAPSKIRYADHIPNYPEAVDQMTRLNLVSLLALVEDKRAVEALRGFLTKRSWGITGVAASLLLQEGDETSLEVVRSLLSDSDPDVRLQACLVLAMMGRDESVLADLQGAYGGASHERKLQILESLTRIGSVESHSFLVGLLKESFPVLKIAAAAALIQILNR